MLSLQICVCVCVCVCVLSLRVFTRWIQRLRSDKGHSPEDLFSGAEPGIPANPPWLFVLLQIPVRQCLALHPETQIDLANIWCSPYTTSFGNSQTDILSVRCFTWLKCILSLFKLCRTAFLLLATNSSSFSFRECLILTSLQRQTSAEFKITYCYNPVCKPIWIMMQYSI